jgi:hypothetical protein
MAGLDRSATLDESDDLSVLARSATLGESADESVLVLEDAAPEVRCATLGESADENESAEADARDIIVYTGLGEGVAAAPPLKVARLSDDAVPKGLLSIVAVVEGIGLAKSRDIDLVDFSRSSVMEAFLTLMPSMSVRHAAVDLTTSVGFANAVGLVLRVKSGGLCFWTVASVGLRPSTSMLMDARLSLLMMLGVSTGCQNMVEVPSSVNLDSWPRLNILLSGWYSLSMLPRVVRNGGPTTTLFCTSSWVGSVMPPPLAPHSAEQGTDGTYSMAFALSIAKAYDAALAVEYDNLEFIDFSQDMFLGWDVAKTESVCEFLLGTRTETA